MSDVEQIELSLAQAKKMVQFRDQILKLESNREFKRVILDGYLSDEAKRLVSLTADSTQAEHRDDIFLAIQSISMLQQFLRHSKMLGDIAEREIGLHEAELDELREAEAEGV